MLVPHVNNTYLKFVMQNFQPIAMHNLKLWGPKSQVAGTYINYKLYRLKTKYTEYITMPK